MRSVHTRSALLSLAVAALLGTAGTAEAGSWSRSASATTWRGTSTGSVSGTCAGGTCARSATATGPYGGSVSRSGSVTRTAPGSYDYARTTTGVYGGSVTRTGSVSVSR